MYVIHIEIPFKSVQHDQQEMHEKLRDLVEAWPRLPPRRAGNVQSVKLAVRRSTLEYLVLAETDIGEPQTVKDGSFQCELPEGSIVRSTEYDWVTP